MMTRVKQSSRENPDTRPLTSGRTPLFMAVKRAGAVIAILVAIMGLLGYIPGMELLGSLGPDYIPMAPSTAVSFLVLSVMLLLHGKTHSDSSVWVMRVLVLLVILFGILEVAGHFTGMDLNLEDELVPEAGYLGDIPVGRMSPANGGLFAVAGFAVLAFFFEGAAESSGRIKLTYLSVALGFTTFLAGLVFCIAYIMGSPLLYGYSSTIPMALTTSLAFILLGSAITSAGLIEVTSMNLLPALREARMGMSARRRFILLSIILVVACSLVMIILMAVLYRYELGKTQEMLQVTARSRARFIESVARYDIEVSPFLLDENPDYSSFDATLNQIMDAHERFEGFGETGEFTLARRENDQIVFLLSHRHGGVEHPLPVSFQSELAEPMRLALQGASGTVIGLDYRGETVVAAHEPVDVMDLGIVAKIDLAEVRAPFVRAGLMAVAVAFLVILLGMALFAWIGNPMIEQLEKQANSLKKEIEQRKQSEDELAAQNKRIDHILRGTNAGTWEWNVQTGEVIINSRWAEIIGYSIGDITPLTMEKLRSFIHPDDLETSKSLLRECFRGKAEYYNNEFRVRHRSGDWIWVLDRGKVATWTDSGEPEWMFGTRQEISTRKNSEEALKKRMVMLTRPLDSSDGVTFQDLFNTEDIQQLQDQFSDATGVASVITDAQGTPLTRPSNFTRLCGEIIRKTKKGRANCYRSDAVLGMLSRTEATVQTCLSSGLWDAGAGIYIGGKRIANWLIGQVRNEAQNEEDMRKYAREIGADEKAFMEAFKEVPTMSYTRFCRIADVLFTLTRQLSDMAYQNVQQARFITERKKAQDELTESLKREKHQADIVRNTPVAIAIGYPDGSLFDANRAFLDLVGYTEEELRHINWNSILTPEKWERMEAEALSRLTPDNRSVQYEKEYIHKNGTVFPVELLVTANHDESGKVVSYMGFITDITSRKKAEEDRETLERQLHQAQKLESVGRLAGGVAHDFNNMLSVILGNAEIALQQTEPGELIHDNLTEIRDASERSALLTRQLLSFARKETVSPVVLDLNGVVGDMVQMLERLIGEEIELIWNPGKDPVSVKIDPGQLNQILVNLCVNARDAIDGLGRITIETGRADMDAAFCEKNPGFKPGLYAVLSVSDNGRGMSREQQDSIFEPFYTTKKQGKGTGLGLATVYGAVKQNSGFIKVYSEEGLGTTFRIYLRHHSGSEDVQVHRESLSSEDHQNATILLVEDEESILRMTAVMLKKAGYRVLTAETPGRAIEIVESGGERIDLLVTDVIMPEMNGHELSTRILQSFPGVKRLFMSGYTADVIARHGILNQGVNFIQKPFSMNNLVQKVREVLHRNSAAD